MSRGKIQCLTVIKGNQQYGMQGIVTFQSFVEISRELQDNGNAHYRSREMVVQDLHQQVFEWLKEEFPYEFQSYIDMEAWDQAKEYLRL